MIGKPIDVKDRKPNPQLVEQLEILLKRAKNGEIRSLFSVTEWNDAAVSHGWCIDKRSNRRMILSEMMIGQQDFILNIGLEDKTSIISEYL